MDDLKNEDPLGLPSGDELDSALETLTAEVEAAGVGIIPTDAEAAMNEAFILSKLPADLRAGYPANAEYGKRAIWIMNQVAKWAERPAPTVPVTDTKPPITATPEPDYSGLTAEAKISRGYRN